MDYGDYNYDDKRRNNDGNYDRRRNYNFHGSEKRLKLVWDEKGRSLEYTLRVDSTRRGFWMTSGPQKGKHPRQNYLSIITQLIPILID
jgi:hypothetical protein